MGGKTPGSWKPGKSGNPAGRPKGTIRDKIAGSIVAATVGIEPEVLPKGADEASYSVSEGTSTVEGPRPDTDTRVSLRPERALKPRKLTDSEVREGLRALLPAALLRMERDIMSGGEKASQQARYVLDQVIGKPTETVKHTGEGPGWEIRWSKLSEKPSGRTIAN